MSVVRTPRRLKVFVVVASFGEKNLECLQQVIRTYHGMNMDIDLVVTAEAPKSIDLGVKVIIGTPTRNPRSLPFVHKNLFAANVDRYDLYVYTEDDIHVTEENLRAFLRVGAVLPSDEIAGFMRYEIAEDGRRYLPDVHGRFHWQPRSVRHRGVYMIAEFTNQHSGFYVVTNTQLRQAMAAASFVGRPYAGRYEMLESAATDLYVNYGFRKVLCISHFEDFLIHHMPNRYIGEMGVPLSFVKEQIETLTAIQRRRIPATTLLAVEPKVLQIRYGKRYDEKPSPALLRTVSPKARTILSVGCGFGALEHELLKAGSKVTAFPLDSVVGATGAGSGLEMIYGSLAECFRRVKGRRFDCVLITNLLHLFSDPAAVLEECCTLLEDKGTLIIEGRNFDHLPTLIKRMLKVSHYRTIGSFSESGIHAYGPSEIEKILTPFGCRVTALKWIDREWPWPLKRFAGLSKRFGARTWIVEATRTAVREVAVVS